jgi:isopenicillin N synthase-like dioxygenase
MAHDPGMNKPAAALGAGGPVGVVSPVLLISRPTPVSASAIEPVSFTLYSKDFDRFAQALGASFQRYGFAVISDHDLPQARIDAAIADAKAFFALPEETKRQYAGVKGGSRGYIPFGIETAKGADHYDLKEFWHVGRDLPPGHPFRATWPTTSGRPRSPASTTMSAGCTARSTAWACGC